jgi:hypothetical protein
VKPRLDVQWRSPAPIVLGIVLFWAGIGLAALSYPAEFDWRFVTVSSLIYPDRNPAGHGWASAGVVSCGLLGSAWSLARRRRGVAPAPRRSGIRALTVGFLTMAFAGALPERLIWVPKAHEVLALTAFVCLSIGTVRLSWCLLSQVLERLARPRSPNPGVLVWAFVPLAPLALVAATQIYLKLYRPELPWVTITWRTLGAPAYLSFAFWEWVTCAVYSGYLLGLAFAIDTRWDPEST